MESSREQIEREIEVYQDRLKKAQDKLDAMPPKSSSPNETRRIRATMHRLEAEVAHVLGLIRLASEALAELELASDGIIK